MFFRQPAKPEGGSARAGKLKDGPLPFSQYIGEEAARELMQDIELDLAVMEEDSNTFKEVMDDIIEDTLDKVPIIQSFKDLMSEMGQEPPLDVPEVPVEEPAPAPPVNEPTVPPPPPNRPAPPVPEDSGAEWPIPIPKNPRIPTPIPPRMPRVPMPPTTGQDTPPQPRPPMPQPRIPMPPAQPPRMPIPPIKIPVPPSIPVPPVEPPAPPVEAPTKDSGACDKTKEELEKIRQALEALTVGLEAIGKDISNKVDTLESSVTCRSEEIRKDLKAMHQDAVDFSKKIKDAMHEAELKDLEIQERTMKILDAAEDRALERAERAAKMQSQGLFGNR